MDKSFIWILLLLCCCGDGFGGCDTAGCDGGFGGNMSCMLPLLLCCCGGGGFGAGPKC